MAINRWSGGTEDRKRNEKDTKAGDEVTRENKVDASSRLESSEEPAGNPEKSKVLEKFEERRRDS